MYGERVVNLIDDPVVRYARLMIATKLRHRVGRAVRVAHDFADPVGPDRDGSVLQRRRDSLAPPARNVGTKDATVEQDVDLGRDPPPSRSPGAARPPIERSV